MRLTLIDVARYKSFIEQSYSCTIRYFDRPDSFCALVTWPTKIYDDTLAFLFNKCNLTYEQNCIIFKYVTDYIKCSKKIPLVYITGIELGEHAHHMNLS